MRILYVVNNAAFFCSHRLPVALAARQAGHEVALLTGQPGSATMEGPALERLRQLGVTHRVTAFRSGGVAPWSEGLGLLQAVAFMRSWKPDLVHCASPKGVLYGGLAARLTRCAALVLAVSGMGSLFTRQRRGIGALARRAYLLMARLAYGHRNARVIVQNRDDQRLIVENELAGDDHVTLIPGSGVALQQYVVTPWAERQNLVVLPGRLLRDKGVLEFVAAARHLRRAGCDWRFALVGTADYDNPTAVPPAQVQAWVDEGCIEWWGHRDDMVAVYGQARIVCLPSYREGMPKVLLEAAAAGCAVVTTDAVGCREAVLPAVTGDLVPVGDAPALTAALRALIDDPARQAAYGARGRELARERFSLEAVIDRTLDCYAQLAGAAAAMPRAGRA